ncbi:hypothetical protein YC2023_009019 [Brassica napus]
MQQTPSPTTIAAETFKNSDRATLPPPLDVTRRSWLLEPPQPKKKKYVDLGCMLVSRKIFLWTLGTVLVTSFLGGSITMIVRHAPHHKQREPKPDNYTVALRKALMFFNAQKFTKWLGKLVPSGIAHTVAYLAGITSFPELSMDLFAWICLLIAYLSMDLFAYCLSQHGSTGSVCLLLIAWMNLNPNPQGLYCLRFVPTDVEVIDQSTWKPRTVVSIIREGAFTGFSLRDQLSVIAVTGSRTLINRMRSWKRSGKPENIVSGGIMLGTKQLFKFLYTDPTTSKLNKLKTGWSLYEYAIPDPPLPQAPTDDILPVEPTVVVNVFYNVSDDEYRRSGLAVPQEAVQVVEAEDNGEAAQGQEGHVEEDNGGAAQGQEGHVEEDNDNNNNVVNDDEDVFANLAPIANIPNNI